jgi:hypothetical protein
MLNVRIKAEVLKQKEAKKSAENMKFELVLGKLIMTKSDILRTFSNKWNDND